MGESVWRAVLGDIELPDGIAELLDELEGYGWYVRSRWGGTGVRVWPEGGRGKQIVVDIRFPMNVHRREVFIESIAAQANATQREGGK